MKRNTVEFVREGKFAAEVPIDLIEEEGGWSPYLSLDDARKLEAVRLALTSGRRGNGRQIRARVRIIAGVCVSA